MNAPTINELAKIMNGQVIGDGEALFSKIFTDSRIQTSITDTFVAIKGPRFNGHDYVAELFKKGVKTFVVQEAINIEGATCIHVDDTLLAIQQYAQWHREQFAFPVIGITGSNGKTIIKEWLSQLLAPDKRIVKSPKSYNSQLGVPLSVLQIDHHHNLGIFEAGISEKGEMARLQNIIQPSIGIFTNLGAAHDEGFENREEKLAEKLLLFKEAKTIISKEGVLPDNNNITTWAFASPTRFRCGDVEFDFAPPFTNSAYLENLGHCMATLVFLGVPIDEIQQRIQHLHSLPMRLEVKPGKGNSILLNDSYNADLNALEIALDHGRQLHNSFPLTLIVSDIAETGLSGREMVDAIEELAIKKGVNRLITIGPETKALRGHDAYASTSEFLSVVPEEQFEDQVIVLKGARAFEFERISRQLEQQKHETVWEINLSALVNNLNVYRSRLSPQTKVMAMVKALAYGSGDKEVAQLLQHQKVDYLGVAFAEEGIALRKAGITLPILVLNAGNSSFPQLVQHKLEPETYSIQHLKALLAFLKTTKQTLPVHIKLDTGMHRLGFEEKDIPELIQLLDNQEYIHVAGIMTHLAASEDSTENEFTKNQLATFKKTADRISNRLGYKPMYHTLNSAGILHFPEAHLDMVRLGIGLYGIDTSHTLSNKLQQIGTLQSQISQIKTVKAGDSIGYGRAYIASKEITIATIPIGYADGYDRRFSNGKGRVLINGKLAPTVGNVCMDMLMVDTTNITATPGTEVIITSPDLSLASIAESIGTIPYELLTNISPRIQRVYVYE